MFIKLGNYLVLNPDKINLVTKKDGTPDTYVIVMDNAALDVQVDQYAALLKELFPHNPELQVVVEEVNDIVDNFVGRPDEVYMYGDIKNG